MLLEFTVENFRSIKDRQVFSMIAESSKAKSENVFEVTLANGSKIRLLKTAVIYGPNASGKSNLIKAFNSFLTLVKYPFRGAERPVREYNPFLFSEDTKVQPTSFKISFVFQSIKYDYSLSFNTSIVSESLVYFPKGQSQKVFERISNQNDLIHKAKMGKGFGGKEDGVFHNHLIISKFGHNTPHDLLTPVYYYLSSFDIGNTSSTFMERMHIQDLTDKLFENNDNHSLLRRLEKLIQVADTKIDRFEISQHEEPRRMSKSILKSGEIVRESVVETRLRTKIFTVHKKFEDGILKGTETLDFNEASEGTKALFWRGGYILEKLEKGGILIFDELDNSLHPRLVKFLVKLFTHPIANPHNAQLIFATHEVTLLDRDLFRTDQIWITEKNEFGETELYSVQDFEGVREDIPFDKWYMAGKFGGQPNIDDIESIFSNE